MGKHTGKKVIVTRVCIAFSKNKIARFSESYQCPNCYTKLKHGMNFCYECSQKIDWSEV